MSDASKPREWWIWPEQNVIDTLAPDPWSHTFENMVPVIEATPAVRLAVEMHEELLAIAKKVNELLKCPEGMLRAEGKCNDLVCELLMLVPANSVEKARGGK